MKSFRFISVWLAFFGVVLGVFVGAAEKEIPPPGDNPVLTPGFISREEGLSESERLGRKIWFYATAGNDRFHTYVFQQRLGVLIDWFEVLRSETRDKRFKKWGFINDPDCCRPGDPDCPIKSLEETYGFDYCPGDQDLLKFVGQTGYRDPACDLRDPGSRGNKEDPCFLAFGTSTGATGIAKIPQPTLRCRTLA